MAVYLRKNPSSKTNDGFTCQLFKITTIKLVAATPRCVSEGPAPFLLKHETSQNVSRKEDGT